MRNFPHSFPNEIAPLVIVVAMAALISLTLILVACSDGEIPAPSPTAVPTQPPQTPTPVPEPTAAPAEIPLAPVLPAEYYYPSGLSVTALEGSVARYSVTEQLARLSSPIDAVGETGDVRGAIVFDADGRIDPARSVIVVALAGLKSDESRRDQYVSDRIFETSRYPNAELTITGVEGLDWPFPESGETTFRLMGDMTIKGVSSPVTWDVEARSSGGAVTGQAKTVITFDQFQLDKPKLAFIISVEDEIRLELDIVAIIESLL